MFLIQKTGRRALAAGLALVMYLPFSAGAQDNNASLPVDPNVVTGTFANGLKYYVRTNRKPENKVELRLVVKTGSIMEDADQQGLAHFMEHMNFNGLQHFEKNQLESYLQSIGVQFGADLNAYTAFDQTVFILPIPTDKKENLENGFQIIEDWAHNALLTDKDINEERAVVLEESRLGKGADDRMMKKYFPKYASGTKYAERLPIGKDEILKTFKPDVIRRFYHDWYRPDLQAIIVVGDIDTATAMNMLRKHFAGIANPANERKRDYLTVQPRMKAEAMVVTDKEAISSGLQLIFPYQKKRTEKTLADYREDLKRQLVLSMINHRLSDLAQGAHPPFPYASVGFDGDLIHGYESFTASTTFDNDGPQKSLDAVVAELLRAKQYGFTETELEQAKKAAMSGVEKLYNERKTTQSSDYVEEYIRNFLTDEPFPGIANEHDYYQQMLPSFTLAELNALPAKWIASTGIFTLITAPQKSEIKLPTDVALLAMTQKSFTQKVTPPAEEKIATSLMTTLPAAGKVTAQQKEDGLDATTYTLSNGILVTIRHTDFKSDEILLNGLKKGGLSNYGAADKFSAKYAPAVTAAMGVGNYTPTEAEKIMAGKPVAVKVDVGQLTDDVSGSSNVKDFESMLQLMYLRLTAPRMDKDLYDAFVSKERTQLQFLSANPQVAFIDTTVKVLYHNNPLAPSLVPNVHDIDAINLDRSVAIYKAEFSNAAGYHFFLAGNVTPEMALPLLETYLGSIPAGKGMPDYKDNGVRPIDGKVAIEVKHGKEKQSMILELYEGPTKYSEDISLKAEAVAEVLNIKIIEDLREKMGGIYSGGGSADVTDRPYAHYSVQFFLPCGPENVAKLKDALQTEIADIQANGPSVENLNKVKNQWREKYRTDVKENAYWQGKMESILFWGRDRQHVLQYETWIDKLTPADVQEAAKMLFGGKNQFISVLYPES